MSCSSQAARAASSRMRACERRSASGSSSKSVQPASLQSRSRQTRASLALSFGRAETCLFALPLLGQCGALLRVGLCVPKPPGQLARQLAGRVIAKVLGDASRQRRDVAREIIGVAIDAANPALMIAAIGELFEQLADLGQEDLGLLGRGLGLQADPGHHRGPLDSPQVSSASAVWSESSAVARSARAVASLVSSFARFCDEIVVPLDHRLGLLEHLGQVRVRGRKWLVPSRPEFG